MKPIAEASIRPCFTSLNDPRQKGKIEHMLQDIIIIAICAVISIRSSVSCRALNIN